MMLIQGNKKDKNGVTLLELLIVIAIFTSMSAGLFNVFFAGQATWFDTDTSIEIQQNLRKALQRITRELHESGFDKDGIWQVAIFDGTGVNNTDILRFSVPIICETDANIIDINGDVSNWGAPLTWGCTDPNCMDADNDCGTRDYAYISYLIDNSNQLLRRVLDPALTTIREDIFVQDIVDFQVTSSVDNNVVTLDIFSKRMTALGRNLSASVNTKVYLRN